MCSIVASFDTKTLKELIELNSYRGSYSHSISYFDPKENVFRFLEKKFGPPNLDDINIPDGCFSVCHVQAPTTQSESSLSIHPAIRNRSLLWHNGILKPSTIDELRYLTKSDSHWDTQLLLEQVETTTLHGLDWIDGSFSCIYWDSNAEQLYHFRNEISPMFWDDDYNFSSTKFEGSRETDPNTFYLMDVKDRTLIPLGEFKTACNPYYFGE